MSRPTAEAESTPEHHDQAEQHGHQGRSTYSLGRPNTVYRLREIPDRYERTDIPGILRSALQRGDDFPVEVNSLAGSPYLPDQKIATLRLPQA